MTIYTALLEVGAISSLIVAIVQSARLAERGIELCRARRRCDEYRERISELAIEKREINQAYDDYRAKVEEAMDHIETQTDAFLIRDEE
jgi:hypothetical protein